MRRTVEMYGWLNLAALVGFGLLVKYGHGRPEANAHPQRRPSVGPGWY